MFKLVKGIFVLSSVLWLSACGGDSTETESTAVESSSEVSSAEVSAITVSFSFEEDEEAVADLAKEVEVEEGQTVLEALQANYEVTEEGGMVTAIEGIEQNEEESKWWLYSVNDEQPNVGAAEYILQDGDEVKWTLNAY